MLEFANTLRRLDPGEITTYRIESSSETLSNGDKVERPRIGGDNMTAILSVFKGEAMLGEAPDQVVRDHHHGGRVAVVTPGDRGDDRPRRRERTTLPVIEAEENTVGIVPDRDAVCD